MRRSEGRVATVGITFFLVYIIKGPNYYILATHRYTATPLCSRQRAQTPLPFPWCALMDPHLL